MSNLHMHGCIFQLSFMPTLFVYSPFHCREGSWELYFPRFQVIFPYGRFFSKYKKEKKIHYSSVATIGRQVRAWRWLMWSFFQWLPNILLRNIHFCEAAKVNGSSFPYVLALLDFLKACRGFPDIHSPSPLNGLVNLSFPMLNPILFKIPTVILSFWLTLMEWSDILPKIGVYTLSENVLDETENWKLLWNRKDKIKRGISWG